MLNIHFLPGFLGLSSDWQPFEKEFRPHFCIFHEIENYLPASQKNEDKFHVWANKFNSSIFDNQQSGKKMNLLVGYSLGGRLALHCLTGQNSPWDAAIIISASPGLVCSEEKQRRLQNDESWAKRFLSEEWGPLINSWNAQEVFSGLKNNLVRNEKDYNREKIAQILVNFSPSRQENLREKISALNKPLLWLAGELDPKFASIADEMSKLNLHIKSFIFKKTGHRIPWENKREFMLKSLEFISML